MCQIYTKEKAKLSTLTNKNKIKINEQSLGSIKKFGAFERKSPWVFQTIIHAFA